MAGITILDPLLSPAEGDAMVSLWRDYGSYGQRWQAETGFSVVKRRLGSAVNGRSYQSQCRELMLFVLTYNLMLN